MEARRTEVQVPTLYPIQSRYILIYIIYSTSQKTSLDTGSSRKVWNHRSYPGLSSFVWESGGLEGGVPSQDHIPHSWPQVLIGRWPIPSPAKVGRQGGAVGQVAGSAHANGNEDSPELPRPDHGDRPQQATDLEHQRTTSCSQSCSL